jgi:hypothetical protein
MPEMVVRVCSPKVCSISALVPVEQRRSHALPQYGVVCLTENARSLGGTVEDRVEFVLTHEFLHLLLYDVDGWFASRNLDLLDWDYERRTGQWDLSGLPRRVMLRP